MEDITKLLSTLVNEVPVPIETQKKRTDKPINYTKELIIESILEFIKENKSQIVAKARRKIQYLQRKDELEAKRKNKLKGTNSDTADKKLPQFP